MSNSLVNANLTLTIQDQLAVTGTNAQSFVNRIVPTLSFQSSNVASYTGYVNVLQGVTTNIVPVGVQALVLYIRCVGPADMQVTLVYGDALGVTVSLFLDPNGFFFYGNSAPLTSQATLHYVTNVNLVGQGGGPNTVAECLVAY